jgi:hypothetical protein
VKEFEKFRFRPMYAGAKMGTRPGMWASFLAQTQDSKARPGAPFDELSRD